MDIWLTLGLLLVAAIFCFLVFFSPSSNLVFSSQSEAEVMQVKNYLEERGIQTYMKNGPDTQSLTVRNTDLGQPSLHVVCDDDRKNALRLLNEYKAT